MTLFREISPKLASRMAGEEKKFSDNARFYMLLEYGEIIDSLRYEPAVKKAGAAFEELQLAYQARFKCDKVPSKINKYFNEALKKHDCYFLEACASMLHDPDLSATSYLAWLKEPKEDSFFVETELEEIGELAECRKDLEVLELNIARLRAEQEGQNRAMEEFENELSGLAEELKELKTSSQLKTVDRLCRLRFNRPFPPELSKAAFHALQDGNYALLEPWRDRLAARQMDQDEFNEAAASDLQQAD